MLLRHPAQRGQHGLGQQGAQHGERFVAPATRFQEKFARAGHAHAGVLLILALVCQVYADVADLGGFLGWLARTGVAIAALWMPGGFFLASMGAGRTEPNRFFVLIPAGAVVLAGGLASLGVGLLIA